MKHAMTTIDGLKVTMTGRELRERLGERIRAHEERAERWERELTRTSADQTVDEPLLPDHMCQQEMQRASWRVEVLAFVRDRIEADATYRLGESDLTFGELLPEKPCLVEQADFEHSAATNYELHRMRTAVERFARRSDGVDMGDEEPVRSRRPRKRKVQAAKARRRRQRTLSLPADSSAG